jgi:hypothetical protein
MCTYSARTRRKVRQEARGLFVRRVVICWWARLEYEDAQVRVCRRKTACDETTSSATYRASSLSKKKYGTREGRRGWRTACDDDIVLFVDMGGCGHYLLAA